MSPDREVPISEFRANMTDHIALVRMTNIPLFLTRRGKRKAVILSVEAYEKLQRNLSN